MALMNRTLYIDGSSGGFTVVIVGSGTLVNPTQFTIKVFNDKGFISELYILRVRYQGLKYKEGYQRGHIRCKTRTNRA